jgi:hypothetical protein
MERTRYVFDDSCSRSPEGSCVARQTHGRNVFGNGDGDGHGNGIGDGHGPRSRRRPLQRRLPAATASIGLTTSLPNFKFSRRAGHRSRGSRSV